MENFLKSHKIKFLMITLKQKKVEKFSLRLCFSRQTDEGVQKPFHLISNRFRDFSEAFFCKKNNCSKYYFW